VSGGGWSSAPRRDVPPHPQEFRFSRYNGFTREKGDAVTITRLLTVGHIGLFYSFRRNAGSEKGK